MSSTSFTHVANTVVSASQLLSTLDGGSVKSLEYLAATKPTLPVVLSAGLGSIILGAELLQQAAISKQLIELPTATATYNLYVGSDSTSQAQAFVRLFDLTTTSKKVLLTFQLSGTDSASGVINLANYSGTHASIDVYAQGASAAATQVLFTPTTDGATKAGNQRFVEVYATSLTSGSEVVGFNVLTPEYTA